MKKKLFSLAVVLICLAILASGTIAYFTAEDTAHNVITSASGIKIEIVEKTMDDYGTLVDFPEGGIEGVMPGSSISKIVSVENVLGSQEAWIRVHVGQRIVDGQGNDLPLNLNSGEQIMTYTVVEDDWTLWEGWYYYRHPVPAGGVTELLFEQVRFAPGMGNEYQNCTAYIEISAQAVQTANNGDHVMEAQGWPTEVTD